MRSALGVLAGVWLLLAAAFGSPALAADPPSEADRTQIRDVIARQLEAFKRDDGVTAFSFAAPGIKSIFGTVENFMSMVRNGYQPVHRWRSFAFRDIRLTEDLIIQKVHIEAQDGSAVTAFYVMEKQPDGTWRIAGCSLGAPEEQST
jgi:ketosteroid isomerase-like protein